MQWQPISEWELADMEAKDTCPEIQRLLAEISRLRAIMKINGWKVEFVAPDELPGKVN
jgi:hypothetical protein